MAREVLERVHAIPWRLREAVRPQRTTQLIGMPSGLHPALRGRVRELADACRETCELKRRPGRSGGLAEAVRDGRLALALVRLPVSGPGLGLIEVMRERLIRAVEDAYGSRSYRDLGQERDRKQLAVLAVLAALAALQDAGTGGERHRENGA